MSAHDRWHLFTAWGPVGIWAAVIWTLGGDTFSAPETSRFLVPLLEWLLPGLDAATRFEIALALRKLAHPGVYGVLALLALRGLEQTTRLSGLSLAAPALAAVAAVASADELRQAGSEARTGALGDVLLDVAGSVIVVALFLGVERVLGRRLFAPPHDDEVAEPSAARKL